MSTSKGWAQLRRIMYEPSTVWLATENSGTRWLTDQFVLYDVTNLEELYCYDSSYDVVWPDGPYQLTVSKGFKPRDSVPEPDIEAYFEKVGAGPWSPATPTEWSVAEHPGKAMLWAHESHSLPGDPLGDVVGMEPCLLGESTWTELKRYHPDAVVEWAPNKGAGTFRFSETFHIDPEDDCAAHECGCAVVPFAFAAAIRCPEGQEDVASQIVSAAA